MIASSAYLRIFVSTSPEVQTHIHSNWSKLRKNGWRNCNESIVVFGKFPIVKLLTLACHTLYVPKVSMYDSHSDTLCVSTIIDSN